VVVARETKTVCWLKKLGCVAKEKKRASVCGFRIRENSFGKKKRDSRVDRMGKKEMLSQSSLSGDEDTRLGMWGGKEKKSDQILKKK